MTLHNILCMYVCICVYPRHCIIIIMYAVSEEPAIENRETSGC